MTESFGQKMLVNLAKSTDTHNQLGNPVRVARCGRFRRRLDQT
jgi:hypothetical protein